MPVHRALRHLLLPGALITASLAFAQTPPAAPASAPASAASAAAPAAARATSAPSSTPAPARSAPPEVAPQQVEVTGGRISDTEQRRQSTATKIIIGREEIEKFGDATVGEVLRRLPGVTTPGAPGRGGPPRMRGLGSGYTQLLIDGQRIPPGFSLESLTPEQVERIEVLRAPTAETGSRAIAGTINIITREGFIRRVNDLRLGFGYENGEISPGLFWTHNDNAGALTYNLSAGLFSNRRRSSNDGTDDIVDLASGDPVQLQQLRSDTQEQRRGLNLTGRLQWRLSESGDTLMLMPTLFTSRGSTTRDFTLTQTVPAPPALPLYDLGNSHTDSSFTNGRLGLQWRQRVAPGSRLEVNGHFGAWQSDSVTDRYEYYKGQPTPLRTTHDDTTARERSGLLTLKLSSLIGGDEAKPGTEQSLVSGLEIEAIRRNDTRISLQDGRPVLVDFGDNLQASSLRAAGYVQDEWSLTPQWAVHAGLRGESITTQGDAGDGTHPTNRSAVWTPLVHLLWKPDPQARDQVRLSLTRSYRAPSTSQLIARPSLSSRYPPTGPNFPNSPDSAGNPYLKPELASGLDLAFERYLQGGGLLSANLFYRQIQDLMRNVTAPETVSWSPVPRFVSRPQNIGSAQTAGIELEAKFRLDQLVEGAPGVEMRSNLSLYRSRVEGIQGPDNRLDSQAPASANVGADYRLRGLPFTLGGNVNWTPGYRSQLAVDRASQVSTKLIWDGFALWTIQPDMGLRLLASNLAPRDYASAAQFTTATQRETTTSSGPSYTNWQLRLELKL